MHIHSPIMDIFDSIIESIMDVCNSIVDVWNSVMDVCSLLKDSRNSWKVWTSKMHMDIISKIVYGCPYYNCGYRS